MNKAIFCKATDEQAIKLIESLAAEIWSEYYTPALGKSQVDYMLDTIQSKQAIHNQIKDGYLYYLIKNNDHNIGYLAVHERDNHLFLSKIYIKSGYRGKGYGKQAIQFTEKLARERNHSKVELTVYKHNLNSIKSYQKLGFNITEPVVADIGNGYVMDDYKMEKEIKTVSTIK